MLKMMQKLSNRIIDLEKERDIQKAYKPYYPKREDNNQWKTPPPKLASINITEIGGDNFYTFHQQPHSEKKCPQWSNSMSLVMNKLLDSKLTEDSGEKGGKEHTIEKQEDDTMFLWNGVSLFNTEENALKSQYTPTATKDKNLAIKDNAILLKVKELQEKVKRQVDVNAKGDMPKDTTCKQEIEPLIELAKPVEDDEERKAGKLKEELPTKNQPVEEKIELIKIKKTSTPPFLVTLEILNHKVHNCLVDSGSSMNVMPLAVCKKLNGQLKPTIWDVTQLDKTSVKVVGEIENVLIWLSASKRTCHYIDIIVADIPEAATCKQETEPLVEPAKPVEDDEERKADKLQEKMPTINKPVEEKIELTSTRKTSAPPFLVTLEILNHKVHNCLVDSGSSMNVMPLAVCKKING